MELYLHEAITLISLDDEKGNFTAAGGYINYAFAAALVMDLILEERAELRDDYLHLTTNAITESRALNQYIDDIRKRKKELKIKDWLHLLVTSSKYRNLCVDRLVQQGILQRTEKKVLWVFTLDRYPMLNGKPEKNLRERLRALMLEEQAGEPTEKERMLLGIVHHCHLYPGLLPEKQDRKTAKARLEILTSEGAMQSHLGKAIQDMHTAIMVTTMATVS